MKWGVAERFVRTVRSPARCLRTEPGNARMRKARSNLLVRDATMVLGLPEQPRPHRTPPHSRPT